MSGYRYCRFYGGVLNDCESRIVGARTMKRKGISILLSLCLSLAACGGGSSTPPTPDKLSGNWEITLQRHAHPEPFVYTGFLQQSNTSVTGSLILGGGCDGVGTVTGTSDGKNLSLTLNEFGQDVSLTAPLPAGPISGGTFLSGSFSSLAGGCTDYASTGTWSALIVAPLKGAFHGTYVSANTGTHNVTGTLNQGANTGSSNTTLAGTITETGPPDFCPYLTTATLTGLISGTNVALNFFGPNGSEIGAVPAGGSPAIVTADGSSLTASSLQFQSISTTCPGDTGALTLTFP
jgi:hypothetical protein